MQPQIISCPYCGQSLEVPEECVNQKVECPNCSQRIFLELQKPSAPSLPVPLPEQEYRNTDSFLWARCYLRLAPVAAILILLSGGYQFYAQIQNYQHALNAPTLQIPYAERVELAQQQQQLMHEYYALVFMLDQAAKSSASENGTPAFRIPDALRKPESSFPGNLNHPKEIDQAYIALRQIRKNTEQLSEILQKTLRESFPFPQAARDDQELKQVGVGSTPPIIVALQNSPELFPPEARAAKIQALKEFRTYLETVQQKATQGQPQTTPQINLLLQFIENNFLAMPQAWSRLGGQRGDVIVEIPQEDKPAKQNSASDLAFLASGLADALSSNWSIHFTIERLNANIDHWKARQQWIRVQQKILQDQLIQVELIILLLTLLPAFLCMVFADLLRAQAAIASARSSK